VKVSQEPKSDKNQLIDKNWRFSCFWESFVELIFLQIMKESLVCAL